MGKMRGNGLEAWAPEKPSSGRAFTRPVAPDEGRVKLESGFLKAATVSAPEAQLTAPEPARAKDVMVGDVKSAPAGTNLRAIARIMREQDVGIVPIIDEEHRLLGVVTDRDIVVSAVAGGASLEEMTADKLVVGDVVKVHPEEDLHQVLERMGSAGLSRMMVVDDDRRLVGIVSISDIAAQTGLRDEVVDALVRIVRVRAAPA
jgi:CBS domain-containing protein